MSFLPYDSDKQPQEIVVQKTEAKPLRSTDSRGLWWDFLDGLRRAIGFKPLYLAERWGIAKVRKIEVEVEAKDVDNQVKLIQARVEAEKAMSAIRTAELDAKTKAEKEKAVIKHITVQTRDAQARARITELAANMLEDESKTPEEIQAKLDSVISQIQAFGGCVELDIPERDLHEKSAKPRKSSKPRKPGQD